MVTFVTNNWRNKLNKLKMRLKKCINQIQIKIKASKYIYSLTDVTYIFLFST